MRHRPRPRGLPRLTRLAVAALVVALATATAHGQPLAPSPAVGARAGAPADRPAGAPALQPAIAPPVRSMGQPRRWEPYASAGAVFSNGALALLGVHHPFGSPVNGLIGVAGEGYGILGDESTGGVRALGVVKAIGLGLGADWDLRDGGVGFLMSFQTGIRRGGLLGRGSPLRFDWSRARGDEIALGMSLPLAQPYAGRTRPKHTGISLDSVADARRGAIPRGAAGAAPGPAQIAAPALPAAADSALAAVDEAARLIRVYTNFFSEKHESSRAKDVEFTRKLTRMVHDSLSLRSPRYPSGRTFAAAQRVYAASLARAFAVAVGDSARGTALGRRARAGLLETVLLPYDAQFGRVKNRQNDLGPLLMLARDDFAAWLADTARVTGDARARAIAVHERLLGVATNVHRAQVDQWTDSRRLWLPLQLGLQPEDHDTQAEIDALIERALQRRFSAGNRADYLASADLQLEFARSIVLARDYHVLWVHDFVAVRPDGTVDVVGFRQAADVYFRALTEAAARFDSTGRFPTYLVFLDQNFYEPAKGRLWMTMLEDPLHARIELPAGYDSLAAVLRQRQAALRQAVAGSRGLQAAAARAGGDDWLRRTIKVHVSITQPSDFTFRSHRIVPPFPFLPDNLMRDHRKIAFYDLNESDPWRGALIIAGAGVGEQYASPTWQDKALRLRGPAALEARSAARRLLRLNGFRPGDVPLALRDTVTGLTDDGGDVAAYVMARSKAADGAGDTATGDTLAIPGGVRAIFAHNEPGFGRKQASVAKAMLYSLAPPGSVIVAPDPIWIGSNWAGMLVGAALRGCKVYVVAPSLANAPSAGFPQLSRAEDVLLRMVHVREEFGPDIRAVGGELRIGVFVAEEDVNDVVRSVREIARGVRRAPWLLELFPFDTSALAALARAADSLEASGYRAFALGSDFKPRRPQFHQKTQFVADGRALAQLSARPEWGEVFARGVQVRALQSSRNPDLRGADALRAALLQPADSLYRAFLRHHGAPPLSFYLTIGTQNQDDRGMMLDGEATMVVSGVAASFALTDFFSLMARSEWIENGAQLDRLLPPVTGWKARFGRRIRFVL